MSALSSPKQTFRRVVALAGVLMVVAPSGAHASVQSIYTDCLTHGRLTKSYSQKDYNAALANAPTDAAEYSDCVDIIRKAQLAAASGKSSSNSSSSGGAVGGTTGGGGGGTGSGGGSAGAAPTTGPGTPKNADQALQSASAQERAQVAQAQAAAPLDTNGKPIDLSKSQIGGLGTIPTPLLIVLAVLALAAAGGAGAAVNNRVRRRTAGT